jgi:hypothetical protein
MLQRGTQGNVTIVTEHFRGSRYILASATTLRTSRLILELGFLDVHVPEFAGLEDFTAFEAFNEFGIFIAGYDLYTRVLTLIHLTSLFGGLRRRDWTHKSGRSRYALHRLTWNVGNCGYFSLAG